MYRNLFHAQLDGREALYRGDWKLLHLDIRSENPRYELYNLREDPAEEHNVIDRYPGIAEELKALMRASWQPDPAWPLFGE